MIDKYAVFGNPIAHSKSPTIHSAFARDTKEEIIYEKILAPVDGFEDAITKFIIEGGKGANVTLPFKEKAFKLCNKLSELAECAKAVNTLVFSEDGSIQGDNTDGLGLIFDLKQSFGDLTGKRVLLIGAGGAARGAIFPLLQSGIISLVVCNRTYDKAKKLVTEYNDFSYIEAQEIDKVQGSFDIIINSTSASLSGQLPTISSSLITAKTCCYDMMYGAELTAFNQWALQQGAKRVQDGLGMLVGQAAKSFQLWRGKLPSNECQKSLIANIRKQLE